MISAAPAVAAPPPGYKLVWSDEFDTGTAPDPHKWSYDTEANAIHWWHDEAQYYSANRPENARIENGHLIIEVRREELSRTQDYAGQHYSSARLITRGKAAWTYGFFDIRAKLPCNRGGWPAIWLVGDAWPKGGEIDIMEQLGFDPATIYGTLHSPHSESDHVRSGGKTIIADSCTAFHDYQAEWTPTGITILVDGKSYYHADKPAAATPENWPFDRPESLILNVAMGGGWAGQKGIDDSALPARMEVDYVRVYQKSRRAGGKAAYPSVASAADGGQHLLHVIPAPRTYAWRSLGACLRFGRTGRHARFGCTDDRRRGRDADRPGARPRRAADPL